MKHNKQKAIMVVLSFVLVSAILFSCKAGLGDAPDIEAPTLSITEPLPLTYAHKAVTLKGACSDNYKVTRIAVCDAVSGIEYGTGTINGNEWSAQLELPEGEITLRCTAYDANKNTSVDSVRQITLLVDETAPEGFAWYISRGNGIQTRLYEKEELEAFDTEKSANKDIAQNMSFIVCGNLSDNLSIASVSLNIYNAAGIKLLSVANSSTSQYSPEFLITHEMLVAVDPMLASGKHYLKTAYYTKDEAGNEREEELLWLLWYPESDIPHILQSQAVENQLTVPVSSSIPVEFFDDDGLQYAAYALLDDAQYAALGETDAERIQNLISDESKRIVLTSETLSSYPRDYVVTLETGLMPTVKYLTVLAQDFCSNGTPKYRGRIIKTMIADAESPILVISSPAQNTVPSMDASGTSFTINGYTLDTKGCTSLKFAFIPSGLYASTAEKQTKAKEVLSTDTTAAGNKTSDSSGIVVWADDLEDDGTEDSENISWKKQKFEISLDLLHDFRWNGSFENKSKFFEIMLTDTDGNTVFQEYQLSADETPPTLQISYPSSDMQVLDFQKDDLTLSFSAVKENGVAINPVSYRIDEITMSGKVELSPLDVSDNDRSYTISKESLTEGQRTFEFYAEDILGNESTVRRTVVMSTLPRILSVTSSNIDQTYKAGDSIAVQVLFSAPVKVLPEGINKPKLKLTYTEDGAESDDCAAVYTGGSGTDTLIFTFTVPADAESDKLCCSTNPIDLNGAVIKPTDAGEGDAHCSPIPTGGRLQDNKTLSIDAKAPVITGLICNNGIDAVFTTNGVITASVTASEPLRVSGSPILTLSCGDFSFKSLSGSTLVFEHTVSAATQEGSVTYTLESCFNEASRMLITDSAGNPLSLTAVGSGTTDVSIDKTPPAAPILSLATGNYNENKILMLSGIETGAAVYYSINGGIAWNLYSSGVPLGSGSYQLTAYQSDAAGNKSPNAATAEIEINANFPTVTSLSCSMPDGTYPAGTDLIFKMSFAEKIKTIETGAQLELFASGSGKYARVTESNDGTTALIFTYKVQLGDSYTSVSVVSAALTNVTDMYGNVPNAGTVTDAIVSGSTRPNIKIDGVAPVISTYSPSLNAITATGNVITLTFSEPVFKETGTLTLLRKGDWYIPPVLTETEFFSVYNELSSADQEKLMETENGSIKLHEKTGQPVGPYKKITHGLVISGTAYVPDTKTKYVLDFAVDISGTSTQTSELREVFEKAGYHKQSLDVTSSAIVISGNTVAITFPTALVDGREWELVVDSGTFRDAAGNTFGGIASGSYSFWSDTVARPVIRVDRYSHGWGASEPNLDGTLTTIANNADIETRPTGYARVRVDCETPDAVITYGQLSAGTYTATPGSATNVTPSAIADIAAAEIASAACGTGYSGFVIVGDGLLTTARKDYIAATATKTGFAASSKGVEGVFKTLVIHHEDSRTDTLRIEGGTTEGGMPTISGFPLRDADLDPRFGKYAYGPDDKCWYWISYEIVSNFRELSLRGNYSQNYPSASYGQLTYVHNQSYYNY